MVPYYTYAIRKRSLKLEILAISYSVFMHVKIIALLMHCAGTSEFRSAAYITDSYVLLP